MAEARLEECKSRVVQRLPGRTQHFINDWWDCGNCRITDRRTLKCAFSFLLAVIALPARAVSAAIASALQQAGHLGRHERHRFNLLCYLVIHSVLNLVLRSRNSILFAVVFRVFHPRREAALE